MRDHDFHPREHVVRVFDIPESGVLRRDDTACVVQTRQPHHCLADHPPLVLRHWAFTDEWFKINATFDLEGEPIETGPPEAPYAVNIDIATPMNWCSRDRRDISAVDLFLDVLVRHDGSYVVVDDDEFERAATDGLISSNEVHGARRGLDRVVDWIETGKLHQLLTETSRSEARRAPPTGPFCTVPVAHVPSVAPGSRPSWSSAPTRERGSR